MTNETQLHSLPVSAYTSEEWFARENEMIFSKTWRYAGLAEDVAKPGDYISVQAGLNNIFIVMGRDKRLRAFHNICRHRGTQLLRAAGKTQKAITCPYHDWTYDLEGNLVSVPEDQREFGGLDKSCYGLRPAAVDRWRGMLWVHPDPNTESVAEWFAGIEPHLGPHRVDELVEYEDARMVKDIAANWKIVVENYIDVYHLAHLHSGTLAMYDHARAQYGFHGPHFAFWEPLSPDYAANLEKNAQMPLLDEIPRDKVGAWVPMLFPALGLGENESSWSTFNIIPLGPASTRVETRTKVKNASDWEFVKQAARSAMFWKRKIKPKFADGHEDDPLASGDFMEEDKYACEQQQKSLLSPFFATGPAAKGESPVIGHQETVLRFLQQK